MRALKTSIMIASFVVVAVFAATLDTASAQESVTFSSIESMLEMEAGQTYEFTATVNTNGEEPVQGWYNVTVGPHSFNNLDFNAQSTATAVVTVQQSTLNACIQGLGWISLSQQAIVYAPIVTTPSETRHIPCSVLISPVLTQPAQLSEASCNDDTLTQPAQPVGVNPIPLDTGWIGGVRTLTYSPAPGYAFSVGTTVSFTYYDNDPCIISPIPPSHTAICGVNNDEVLIPAQPDGVLVTSNSGWSDTSEWRIVFSAAEGYVLSGNTQTEYLFTDNGPCETDAPIPPTQTKVCGWNNDDITVPAQPANVITNQSGDWSDNQLIITFSAADGYVLPDDAETEYLFTDEGPCETNAPIPPTQTEVCGTDNDLVTLESQPVNVLVESDDEWINGTWRISFSAADGYMLPEDAETEYVFVDEGPCLVTPIPPIQTKICGTDNDLVTLESQPANILVESDDEWINGIWRISFSAADGYVLPADAETEYVFVDEGPCLVTPIPPETPVAVCGPDNDIITIPEQPEGVIVEDTGWEANERTLTFIAEEGYAFPDTAPRALVSIDENIPCETGPVGITVVVLFQTSDGGSIDGTPYALYAPVASQTAQQPFIEGEIGPGNQIVFESLITGQYRLVTAPEGYEPVDTTFTVLAEDESEEITIPVLALQMGNTPTPEPTIIPTEEPTVSPTTEPVVTPTAEPTVGPITSLPETGSGQGGNTVIGVATIMLAAMMIIGSRRRT